MTGSGRVTIRGMGHAEPDIAELFAPLRPAQASDVVLNEARQVLPNVRQPIDAELWGSDMLGALTSAESNNAEVMAELAKSLGPAAEKLAAAEAADRVAADGVEDPVWASVIGVPAVGSCWHYSDVGGRQESITASFRYGTAEHALSVLIDHGKGGAIKDAWVDGAEGLLDKTWIAADNDPLIVFETIAPTDAYQRLAKALAAGECPSKPDETDDLTAHRALLHARIRYLAEA